MSAPDFNNLRKRMVKEQLEARQITDSRLLAAMGSVPRHAFVPEKFMPLAYRDSPLPIGEEQTISQPFIVAYMIQALNLQGCELVLEVGTGSGYQTAILCHLAERVISIEYQGALIDQAVTNLGKLNLRNFDLYNGDGSQGMPDMSPFDAIIVSAAAPNIPKILMTQLEDGGRLILPVGDRHHQNLVRVTRTGSAWQVEQLISVMFVPLLGRFGQPTTDPSQPTEPS